MYLTFNRAKLRDRLDASTLRLLTDTEIEWVAGGDGGYGGNGGYGEEEEEEEEIVVTGKRLKKNPVLNYWFFVDHGDQGYGFDYVDSTDGGYGMFVPSVDNPPPVYASAVGENQAPFSAQPHMTPGTERHLTLNEKIAIAGFTNLTDQQLSQIRIRAGGQLGSNTSATTMSATEIRFHNDYALTDFSSDPDTMDLLVHELYHAQQWNTLGASRLIGDQVERLWSNVYTYTQGDLNSVISNPGLWPMLNVEQQAQIAQDYYRMRNGLSAMGADGFTPTMQQLDDATPFN